MEEYRIRRNIKITEVEIPVQQIIVNNEVQNVTAKAFALACPDCGRVIYSFQPGISKLQVIDAVTKEQENLQKHFAYCPECGQKLGYDYGIVQGEVVNER